MRAILSLALAFSLLGYATADECIPSTSDPEVAANGFYVDNDLCQVTGVSTEPSVISVWFGHEFARVPVPVTVETGCLFSIWTYQESNGIDGLQRGDEVVDDTCGGMIDSDTLAFF